MCVYALNILWPIFFNVQRVSHFVILLVNLKRKHYTFKYGYYWQLLEHFYKYYVFIACLNINKNMKLSQNDENIEVFFRLYLEILFFSCGLFMVVFTRVCYTSSKQLHMEQSLLAVASKLSSLKDWNGNASRILWPCMRSGGSLIYGYICLLNYKHTVVFYFSEKKG